MSIMNQVPSNGDWKSTTKGWIEFEKTLISTTYTGVDDDPSQPTQAVRRTSDVRLWESMTYNPGASTLTLYGRSQLYADPNHDGTLNQYCRWLCTSADGFFDNATTGTFAYYLTSIQMPQNLPVIRFTWSNCYRVNKKDNYRVGTTPIAFHLTGSFTDEWYKEIPISQ